MNIFWRVVLNLISVSVVVGAAATNNEMLKNLTYFWIWFNLIAGMLGVIIGAKVPNSPLPAWFCRLLWATKIICLVGYGWFWCAVGVIIWWLFCYIIEEKKAGS